MKHFPILELLPERPLIKVIDVGAMSLGPGTDAYRSLVDIGLASVVGFEPGKAECDKLNAMNRCGHLYLPYAIGDGKRRGFYDCNFPMTSSLYEPNTRLLSKFSNLANITKVVERREVDTYKLDDIKEIADPDFLKLDVQGAELDVLKGAPRSLDAAVVVHTEVEFVPLYKDQPLFAEVDQELRKSGFAFHRFSQLSGRTFQPLVVNGDPNRALSQVLWTDAIYVKDFMSLERLSSEKLLKLALILHEVYRSYDLAAHVLDAYDAEMNSKLASEYLEKLVASSGSE